MQSRAVQLRRVCGASFELIAGGFSREAEVLPACHWRVRRLYAARRVKTLYALNRIARIVAVKDQSSCSLQGLIVNGGWVAPALPSFLSLT
jgi:nitrogenase subunit NifH